MTVDDVHKIVEAYHALIDLEYEKYRRAENLSDAKFSEEEAIKVLGNIVPDPKSAFNELIKKGFIVDLGGYYRTLHFDVAYRSANIRIQYDTGRYPLEAKVFIDEEPLPEWKDHGFEELKDIIKNENVYSALAYALYKEGYKGLGGGEIRGFSNFQWNSIEGILTGKEKAFVLSAPTSGGKTYAFLIPLLVKIIEGKISGKAPRVLLVYPRKSLERDQLNKLISILYRINYFLSNILKLDNPITIGIDDGETPQAQKVNSGDYYRGVTCPRCQNSPLEYSKTSRGVRIRCKSCALNYDWILGTREQIWKRKPDILITNVWTLDWRLPSKTIQHDYKLYDGIEYIVLDEAHVYQSLLGGNIRYLLKRLENSTNTNPRIILASATLPKPDKFAKELLDLDENDIKVISVENLGGKKKKVIYLLMGVHPRKSWETVVYELALLLGTVSYFRGIQSVIFIDSIKSINRIYNTHLKVAVNSYNEPQDHLSKDIAEDPDDSYAFWIYGSGSSIDVNTPKRIFEKIQVHHAGIKNKEEIEKNFIEGRYGVLLATSTLELGVDYPNVGIIVNVGVPFRLESLPQRVGRAGRNPYKTLNTILAIIIVRNTPLEMYYIFRPEELIYGFKNAEIPVSWKNIAVKKYHTLSMLLDELGKGGYPTYVLSSDGLPQNLKSFVQEILERSNDENILKKIESTILKGEQAKEIIMDIFEGIAKVSRGFDEIKEFKQIYSEVNEILWDLVEYLKALEDFAKKYNIKAVLDRSSEIKKLLKDNGVMIDEF